MWIDRQGQHTAIAAPSRGYAYPRISPDGSQIVIDVRDAAHGLWMWDVLARTLTPFSTGRASDIAPVWSHDGQWVLFARGRGVAPGLYRLDRHARDQSSAVALPVATNSLLMPTSLTPDDRTVVVTASVPSGFDLQAADLDSSGAPRELVTRGYDELNGEVSPDGRWLAYQTRESGQFEIWLKSLIDAGFPHQQVSFDGGSRPVWTRQGAELLYVSGDKEMVAIEVDDAAGTLRLGSPVHLFRVPLYDELVGRTFDVTPDGQRFLVVTEGQAR